MDDEGACGDFVPPPIEPFQIDELPSPVLRHLFKFLNWEDQDCIRKLCKGMRYFIEYEYGIHAHLPARHSEHGIRSRLEPLRLISWKLVTDKMITEAIQGLEGRLIRSLKMEEMNPVLNPFPFQKLIQYPWRLLRVSLKYVDVDFLVSLLTSCRNLSEFRYGTGVEPILPEEGTQPIPIPREGEQLIEFITQLPLPTFQVDKLSSLNLRFRKVDPNLHSDWANVAFLLLSLSQRSLHSLKNFCFEVGYSLILKDCLQLLACIGQFLAQCPNLEKLEYSTRTSWPPWSLSDRNSIICSTLDSGTGTPMPQNVLSFLIQKYGTAQLKTVDVQGAEGEGVGLQDGMLIPIRQLMRDAGVTLRRLRGVSFGFYFRIEHDLFQSFLSGLSSPSMRDIDICDETGVSFTGGSYDLLLGQIPPQSIPPFYGYLEKLCVSRVDQIFTETEEDDDANGALSLPRMLNRMRALRHFEFVPRTPYYDGNIEVDEKNEPVFDHLRDGRNDFEISDVTFEDIGDGDVHFQQLQVLRLGAVKISTEAASRLIQLRNLTELVIHILPEYRHQLFGINSGDLLRLMGRLRKLEKLSVKMILFPEEDGLRSIQATALEQVGTLKQMRRVMIEGGERDGERFVYETELMTQYSFVLGFEDDPYWIWDWEWRI